MTQELWVVVWAACLGLVNCYLAPVAAGIAKGPAYMRWNAGPRDMPFDQGPVAERLKRAFANFLETYVFFAVIVIALAFAHKSSIVSVAGAWTYLVARIVYIPLYAFGVTGVRSLAFGTGLIGLLMCLYTLIF